MRGLEDEDGIDGPFEKAMRGPARAPERRRPVIHVRTWSGSLTARVTDMANAGKRGKACRVLRFSGSGAQRADGYGEVLHFLQDVLPELRAETEFDDVALLARAVKAHCAEFELYEETIRGVDAPRPVLHAEGPGWAASADEEGVHVLDRVDQANLPQERSEGSPARAYEHARKIFPTLRPEMTFSQVCRAFRDAGVPMHYWCGMD